MEKLIKRWEIKADMYKRAAKETENTNLYRKERFWAAHDTLRSCIADLKWVRILKESK